MSRFKNEKGVFSLKEGYFHLELIDLLRKYYFRGGLPEVVRCIAEGDSVQEVRAIHKEILTSYTLDFAKHAQPSDIPKLSHT